MASPGALVRPGTARVTRWCTAALAAGLSVAVVCATTASGAVQTAAARRTWLQEINYYRRGAGLMTVTNRRAWDRGIVNHLRYLEKTPAKYFTGQYQSYHTENPASPYYTKSGTLEASRSDLLLGSAGSGLADIDEWLTSPFHAIGMLRNGLRQVAFAAGYIGAGLDVLGGLRAVAPDPKPILFPGNKVTTNLTSYPGDELPNPLQSCRKSFSRKPVGLPIIALLPATPSKHLTASLRWPSGKVQRSGAGALCVVDQFTYRSTDKVYGPTGLEILEGDNAVVLFPSGTLVNGGYTVTISDTAKITYKWRFKVRA